MTIWMAQKEKRFTYEVRKIERCWAVLARRDQKTFHANSLCVFFPSRFELSSLRQKVAISIMKPLLWRERGEESRRFNSFSQAITSFDSINYSLWGWLQMNLNRPSRAEKQHFVRFHCDDQGGERDYKSSQARKKGLSAWNIFRWKHRIKSWKSFQSILRCTTFSTTKHLTTEKRLSSNDRPRPVELSFAIQQRRRKKKWAEKLKSFELEDNKKKRIVQQFEIIIDSLSVIEVHKKVNFLFF